MPIPSQKDTRWNGIITLLTQLKTLILFNVATCFDLVKSFRLTLEHLKIYKIASTRNEISFLQIMSHVDMQIKMPVKTGLKWIKTGGSNMSTWPKEQPGCSVVVLCYAGDCVVCSTLRWRHTVVSSGQFRHCASYSQHSLRSTATITKSHSIFDIQRTVHHDIFL